MSKKKAESLPSCDLHRRDKATLSGVLSHGIVDCPVFLWRKQARSPGERFSKGHGASKGRADSV